jgi:hypothetical protein
MNEHHSMVSRREMVRAGTGFLATSVLMALASPAISKAEENMPADANQNGAPPMQDPLSQYPEGRPDYRRRQRHRPRRRKPLRSRRRGCCHADSSFITGVVLPEIGNPIAG